MRWAAQRQLLYAGGFVVALMLACVGVWFLFFYHPATCSDGLVNQDELGVDCGGVCPTLCEAPRVSALWSRAVPVARGVYHAAALVRNPEADAGTTLLPYAFQLFDDKNILIAERRGVMNINPGETVPLFEPNIITGERIPARTFVTFGNAVWVRMNRTQDPVRITSRELDQNTLTLTAHLENTTALPVRSIVVTAFLYDSSEVLVAASQTVVPSIPARGIQDIVYTWQEPFSREIVRTDIVARVE